jgi:D-glycero-alpha-D-manno-heptose 1-phosphate guanylyltransferase
MEAIILAGGKGTRLKSVVFDRPKPLADVNGEPFLAILMNYLIEQGCRHFILATGYKREMIRSQFGNYYQGIPISYSEEMQPLGTGGAVINAQKKLVREESFLVLNGDTFFPINLSQLKKQFQKTKSDVAIALFKTFEGGRYGTAEQDDQGMIKLANKKAGIGERANGGVFMVDPTKLKSIRNIDSPWSFEANFLPALAELGAQITGMTFNEPFIDIGVPQDYLRFCENMKSRQSTEKSLIWCDETTKRRAAI